MDRFSQLWVDLGKLLSKYGTTYLNGLLNTLILAVVATVIGCIIGFACGVITTIPHSKKDNPFKRFILAALRVIIRIYVEVFRGTPMILQAVFIYYGLPYFTGISFSNIWTVSIIVVSINTGAYMAESVRGGIISIDVGQTEGAMALGMNHFQTMLYVIIPQALRNIMPQIGNNYIINVKDTSVMFIIGFADFFSIHKMVSGAVYQYFPSATIEMIGYLSMTLIASFILRYLEKKMDGKSSYELVAKDSLTMTGGTYRISGKKNQFEERSPEFENAGIRGQR